MTGYDVTRLRHDGPVTEHYEGALQTDGPWLIVHSGPAATGEPALIAPSHAVVEAVPCGKACRARGATE